MNPSTANQSNPYAQTVFHKVRLFPEDCDARRLAARLVQLRRLAQRDADVASVDAQLCQFNRTETELSDAAGRARHILFAHATYRVSFTKLRQALAEFDANPEQFENVRQHNPEVIRDLRARLASLENHLPDLNAVDTGLADLLRRIGARLQ